MEPVYTNTACYSFCEVCYNKVGNQEQRLIVDKCLASVVALLDESGDDEVENADSTKEGQHAEKAERDKPAPESTGEMNGAQGRWQVAVRTKAEFLANGISTASHFCQKEVPLSVL